MDSALKGTQHLKTDAPDFERTAVQAAATDAAGDFASI
jgi:hypothetical protein